MAKIRKGDTVQVIAGKDKGQTGKVLSVDANRILVEGVNRVTKHTKETTGDRGAKVGGILHIEAQFIFQMSWLLEMTARQLASAHAKMTLARTCAFHVAPERTSNVNRY